MEQFDRILGKDQIAVFHINDSKNAPGAAKDRHENIGFGHIGFEALNRIVHHKDFEDVTEDIGDALCGRCGPAKKILGAVSDGDSDAPSGSI